MSDVALRLAGVGKSFDGFEAVRDLSFEVPRGAICGFLGPNGAGKTTSVRMMLGLTAPTRGEIEVLGAPVGRWLDRIGFMPEERGLYRKMTALDVIVFLAGLKGVKAGAARERGRRMLEAQGLGAFAHTQIRSLSKGMSQKVQLISCLVHEPELVILDEPFSGLDPVNQEGLEAMIRDLAQGGATVLFSTHVMQHAERLCEKVVLMAKGRKRFEGTLKAKTLIVGQTGHVSGQISVDTAEIRGMVEDHLVVKNRLVLRSSGSIGGTISYSKIMVEEGGAITGTIEMLAGSAAAAEPEAKVVQFHQATE